LSGHIRRSKTTWCPRGQTGQGKKKEQRGHRIGGWDGGKGHQTLAYEKFSILLKPRKREAHSRDESTAAGKKKTAGWKGKKTRDRQRQTIPEGDDTFALGRMKMNRENENDNLWGDNQNENGQEKQFKQTVNPKGLDHVMGEKSGKKVTDRPSGMHSTNQTSWWESHVNKGQKK